MLNDHFSAVIVAIVLGVNSPNITTITVVIIEAITIAKPEFSPRMLITKLVLTVAIRIFIIFPIRRIDPKK